MEENKIIEISKLRISNAKVISGIAERMTTTGKKASEVIKDILVEFFTGDTVSQSATTTALSIDNESTLKDIDTGVRILVKKIFDLDEAEYRKLIKAKSRKDA